jgi:hypothetical protein
MDIEQAYQQCLERLVWAVTRLGVTIDPTQLSEIAELIVQPMTGVWRFFHTPQHIFEVGGESDAIEVLASLFHDLVYVQVDFSISFNVSYYITPFTKDVSGQLAIREASQLPTDRIYEIVAAVFGFEPGRVLNPFAGQNEFLSALVAAKALEPFLPASDLMQIVACIEATIPFRGMKEGITPSDRLYERLQFTNSHFNLKLSDAELEEAVKKGVRVSNRDVGSFAHPTAAHFLANTWNLLPETNHNLIECSYTVKDYRVALQKMEGFMNFLMPDVIFRRFRGEPKPEIYQLLENGAKRNLDIAELYLGTKLVAIALLEAISLGIGSDVPLATMMGQLPDVGLRGDRLEFFIPQIHQPHEPRTALEWEVLNLLENGREKSANYDLENSPLATFLFKAIGFDEVRKQCKRAKDFFNNNISPEAYIAGFDPVLTSSLIEAIAKLFDSRKTAINRYYQGICQLAIKSLPSTDC